MIVVALYVASGACLHMFCSNMYQVNEQVRGREHRHQCATGCRGCCVPIGLCLLRLMLSRSVRTWERTAGKASVGKARMHSAVPAQQWVCNSALLTTTEKRFGDEDATGARAEPVRRRQPRSHQLPCANQRRQRAGAELLRAMRRLHAVRTRRYEQPQLMAIRTPR